MPASSIHHMIHRYDGAMTRPRVAAAARTAGPWDATLTAVALWFYRITIAITILGAALAAVHLIRPDALKIIAFAGVVLWVVFLGCVAVGKRLGLVGAKVLDDMPAIESDSASIVADPVVAESSVMDNPAVEAQHRDETAERHRLLVKNVGPITYWFDFKPRSPGQDDDGSRRS